MIPHLQGLKAILSTYKCSEGYQLLHHSVTLEQVLTAAGLPKKDKMSKKIWKKRAVGTAGNANSGK